MRPELLDLALRRDHIADLDPAARRLALRDLLLENDLDVDVPETLVEIANVIDGFGPLTSLMEDERITDILVNGPDRIWVERDGHLAQTDASFGHQDDLRAFIDRMLSSSGARADAGRPIADARLGDGSRIHVVLPPVASEGPLVSIRRFPRAPLSLNDLRISGMVDEMQSSRLRAAVSHGETLAISGGTGSGKTTLLNALLGEIDPSERVVVLEETSELRPRCVHHVSLLTRESNLEGAGRIDLSDLVRAALRMRPDRIVVGEVRGPEALAALAAMSVGHAGSMVTVHARSAAAVPDRLVSLALLARGGASQSSLREQVDAAFDLIVHLERHDEGLRRVAHIDEVKGSPRSP